MCWRSKSDRGVLFLKYSDILERCFEVLLNSETLSNNSDFTLELPKLWKKLSIEFNFLFIILRNIWLLNIKENINTRYQVVNFN